MKPNEPSRTALIIALQRAAHQVLDHGSILYDPFAMKILREDEKDVLQFANKHPLASIGRLITTARSRVAEDALTRAVEGGVRQIVILGAGLDKIGERLDSRFEPAGMAAILHSHGFCAIADINFQEIASRFGRAVQGLAPGHAGVHVVHAKR